MFPIWPLPLTVPISSSLASARKAPAARARYCPPTPAAEHPSSSAVRARHREPAGGPDSARPGAEAQACGHQAHRDQALLARQAPQDHRDQSLVSFETRRAAPRANPSFPNHLHVPPTSTTQRPAELALNPPSATMTPLSSRRNPGEQSDSVVLDFELRLAGSDPNVVVGIELIIGARLPRSPRTSPEHPRRHCDGAHPSLQPPFPAPSTSLHPISIPARISPSRVPPQAAPSSSSRSPTSSSPPRSASSSLPSWARSRASARSPSASSGTRSSTSPSSRCRCARAQPQAQSTGTAERGVPGPGRRPRGCRRKLRARPPLLPVLPVSAASADSPCPPPPLNPFLSSLPRQGDLMAIPGLEGLVSGAVRSAVAAFVWPRRMVLCPPPLSPRNRLSPVTFPCAASSFPAPSPPSPRQPRPRRSSPSSPALTSARFRRGRPACLSSASSRRRTCRRWTLA